jgi:hypothetical protein
MAPSRIMDSCTCLLKEIYNPCWLRNFVIINLIYAIYVHINTKESKIKINSGLPSIITCSEIKGQIHQRT